MKAITVYPGKPHSMHLEDVLVPNLTDIPGGRGVLVKVLRVGVDGTDKEINAAEYGNAPRLENYAEMLRHLTEDKEAIKVYVEVAI